MFFGCSSVAQPREAGGVHRGSDEEGVGNSGVGATVGWGATARWGGSTVGVSATSKNRPSQQFELKQS